MRPWLSEQSSRLGATNIVVCRVHHKEICLPLLFGKLASSHDDLALFLALCAADLALSELLDDNISD